MYTIKIANNVTTTVPELKDFLYKSVLLTNFKCFNINNSVRNIKLLLSKKEIRSLEKDLIEKGNTLIPLKIYRNKSYLKLELGLGKGRKKYDKRQNIKNKDLIRSESLKIKI